MRILIVEDEILIAMFLETVLGDMGHDVSSIATTPDEAIAEAEDDRPDFALMDIRLAHGTSGIEAAERLWRELGVRCLFLSANLDSKTQARLASFDPLGFIGKPVLPATLEDAVRSVAATLSQAVA